MTEQEEYLASEIRRLTAKIERLQSMQQPVTRYRWLKHLVKDLETNPRKQYRVHQIGVYFWLANFPFVVVLFFIAPDLWLKVGIFITLIYSIYANFATDYGAMSAAMAAFDVPEDELESPSAGR